MAISTTRYPSLDSITEEIHHFLKIQGYRFNYVDVKRVVRPRYSSLRGLPPYKVVDIVLNILKKEEHQEEDWGGGPSFEPNEPTNTINKLLLLL